MFKDLFRPVLSDKTIIKMCKKGKLIEGIISPTQIQPNSIDLTLGNSVLGLDYNNGDIINPINGVKYKSLNKPDKSNEHIVQIMDNQCYILYPGDFALMASKEILNIPNGIIAFVAGRSSVARMGIQVEQAGLIDAGFRGTITFEVCNQTKYPIMLYPGMRIAQVYFIKAQYADKPYGSIARGSKYQRQGPATGSRIDEDPEFNDIRNQ